MVPHILAAICGVLFTAAFAPLNLWFTALALVPFFALVARSERSSQAYRLGFWFGVGFFAVHIFWLPNSLSDIFGPVAWIMYLPIVLIEGVFWGLVTFAARSLAGRGRPALVLLPALWLLMEWARTQGAFAFPWGSVGYVWMGTPLVQAADISGSYGLSLITLTVAALLAAPFVTETRRGVYSYGTKASTGPGFVPVMVALLLGFGTWGYGLYRVGQGVAVPDRQALMVQGATDPLGRAQGTTEDIDVYVRLTEAALDAAILRPELVIWPEGAILREPLENLEGEANRLRLGAAVGDAELITGASVWFTGPSGYQGYNSVYGLANANVTDRYDKVYLVPYGERIIFINWIRPVFDLIYSWFSLPALERLPGPEGLEPLTLSNYAAAVYICYESVFPQVSRLMVARGAQVLVNISNDAWFGKGAGAEQHFQMGVMRAIETRRYLLRAGNDGITASVDPLGRTLERAPRFEETTLTANYALLDGRSPYVRFGDWLIWLTLAYTFGAGFVTFSRRS